MFGNPKRLKRFATQKDTWFDYYAGFSSSFVQTAIQRLIPDKQGNVLDPWNGSGTTTTVSHELGIRSTGIDINPTMAVVAKSKLLNAKMKWSVQPLANEFVARSRSTSCEIRADEPLLEWFCPSSAWGIRSLEQTIRRLLTRLQPDELIATPVAIDAISDLAGFFLVALFRTVRSFVGRFQTSNPTWIKSPRTLRERIRPKPSIIAETFLLHVGTMMEGLAPTVTSASTSISLGSSECLPLPSASVQAVIGSPPYCTRIDYAVATKPELALLGYRFGSDFESLRRQMLGGPVISPVRYDPDKSWGSACLKLLLDVQSHPSKGSAAYYHKLFVQYYGSMRRSLEELNRILVANGHCVLVVQDSHYKEIHVDVARHLTEMASDLNWSLEKRLDFKTETVMARLNSKSQKYRAHSGATESVLWFRTAS